jgi:ATP-dependent DNA helicase PIF1
MDVSFDDADSEVLTKFLTTSRDLINTYRTRDTIPLWLRQSLAPLSNFVDQAESGLNEWSKEKIMSDYDMSKTVVASGTSNFHFTDEQQEILQLVGEGKSLFITGASFTGKSFMLKQIMSELDRKYVSKFAVTSTIGMSTLDVDGATTYSYFGIDTNGNCKAFIRSDSLRQLRTIIIDEAQVMSADFFSAINLALTEIVFQKEIEERYPNYELHSGNVTLKAQDFVKFHEIAHDFPPFGGIQLLLFGDLLQVQQVGNKMTRDNEPVKDICDWYDLEKERKKSLIFARTFPRAVPITVELTKDFVHQDQELLRILNDLRFGRDDIENRLKFNTLEKNVLNRENGIDPVIMCDTLNPQNKEQGADNWNKREYDRLGGEELSHAAKNEFAGDSENSFNGGLDKIPTCKLKVGAQVIALKDIAEIRTGTLGGYFNCSIFSKIVVVTSFRIVDELHSTQNPEHFGKKWKKNIKLPIVKFINGEEVPVEPQVFIAHGPGGIIAKRFVMPLRIAWAFSPHTSRGLIFDRVKIDCSGKPYGNGVLYSAFSRAKSIAKIQILKISTAWIGRVDNNAIRFYEQIAKERDNTQSIAVQTPAIDEPSRGRKKKEDRASHISSPMKSPRKSQFSSQLASDSSFSAPPSPKLSPNKKRDITAANEASPKESPNKRRNAGPCFCCRQVSLRRFNEFDPDRAFTTSDHFAMTKSLKDGGSLIDRFEEICEKIDEEELLLDNLNYFKKNRTNSIMNNEGSKAACCDKCAREFFLELITPYMGSSYVPPAQLTQATSSPSFNSILTSVSYMLSGYQNPQRSQIRDIASSVSLNFDHN